MNNIQLRCLKKEAEKNDFFKDLLNQYEETQNLTEKQMIFVKRISKKEEDAIKNSRKLTEW